MDTAPTFFFYDLETSGRSPRSQRIMQFAGQRTDMNLNPIGEPVNILVALSDDVLPEPPAILLTGITPQKTREEGYNEADFLRLLYEYVITPGTIIVGFNSIRFDDEFMRYTLYRNFYDPYEWQWKDGRSRWDLLDPIRMIRALRPEGIKWPVTEEGHPTNRLELLSSANELEHAQAHDALSDVHALIAITRLLRERQPKQFEYLLKMRSKHEVAKLVNLDTPQAFVYTSGRYTKDHLHTTAVFPLVPGGTPGSVIVWDLRHDPTDWAAMSVNELKEIRFAPWEKRQMEGFVPLPAKELSYTRCPSVAPMGVLKDEEVRQRIKIDLEAVERNLSKLRQSDLADKLREVFARDGYFAPQADCDARLYEGFFNERDKLKIAAVRNASAQELADFHPDFVDERLGQLLLRYKARNYPQSLSEDERASWEAYRTERITADLPRFSKELHYLASKTTNDHQQFLLQELQLWAESSVPAPD